MCSVRCRCQPTQRRASPCDQKGASEACAGRGGVRDRGGEHGRSRWRGSGLCGLCGGCKGGVGGSTCRGRDRVEVGHIAIQQQGLANARMKSASPHRVKWCELELGPPPKPPYRARMRVPSSLECMSQKRSHEKGPKWDLRAHMCRARM